MSRTKRNDTLIHVECMHVLDLELAKRLGFDGPFTYAKEGVSCHLKEEGFPITFSPRRNITDAIMVSSLLNLTIKMEETSAFISSNKADCLVEYAGNNIHHKLSAIRTGVMRVASLHLEIPL